MKLADLFRRHDKEDAAQAALLAATQADLATARAENAGLTEMLRLLRAEQAEHAATHTTPSPVPVLTLTPTPVRRTLFGYAGAPDSIPVTDRMITGTWVAPKTWDNMAKAEWMAYDNDYQDYLRRYPGRAVDVGVPLIPYESQWELNPLLDEIISGARDGIFSAMGASLARNGCMTVYARLAWEMNLAPGMSDRLDRAKFIAAWNRSVPLIRVGFAAWAKPNQKLHIVFCPLSDGADYRAFYPANVHVDVIALDVYASMWRTTTPTEAELLADVQRYLDQLTVFANGKGKPLAIGEWANWQRVPDGNPDSRGLGDFPAYIDLMFDWAQANRVLYMCYFNLAHNTGLTVADTPRSLARIVARTSTTP